MKLIGEKPLVKFNIDAKPCEGLWDMGSMVSLVSSNWLGKEFPKQNILPLNNFMPQNETISLRAANNTELDLVGIALLNFTLPSLNFKTIVPFLVTNNLVSYPIIGFNVIKYITENCKSEEIPVAFQQVFPSAKGNIMSLINAIKNNEAVCVEKEVTVSNDVTLPSNTTGYIMCKIENKPNNSTMLFEPCLDIDGVEFAEIIIDSDNKITKIPYRNTSDDNVNIESKTCVGYVCEIQGLVSVDSVDKGQAWPTVDCCDVDCRTDSWLPDVDLSHLNSEQRSLVEKLLIEYCDVFSKNSMDIGDIKKLQMEIILNDTTPIHKPYRRIPKQLYAKVKDYLDNLELNGWITRSTSSYASPIVCVRKKDGSLRLCVDYRDLNNKTIPDRMPIPKINDVIDNLGGKSWFSTLDFTKAYHQGYIHENSRHLTAFSTPWALFEWVRIPYGLTNAPPKFQRFVNECLDELIDVVCNPYMDDVLGYDESFEKHLESLRKILQKLREHGVKLRADKCNLFKRSVKYLGKIITSEGYYDDPATTEAVEKLKKPPSTVGELRSLLGFWGTTVLQ